MINVPNRLLEVDMVLLLSRVLTPTPPHPAELRDLVEEVDSTTGIGAALTELSDALVAANSTELESERTRLFQGNTVCPINETAYVRRDKGQILADICGFYNAFGLQPAAESGEKPDHLSAELEFVAALLFLSARATASEQDEQAETTERALHSFLDEHLGEWLGLFVHQLERSTRHPVYVSTASLLREVWQVLATERGLHALDESGAEGALVHENDETPYECGMAEGGCPLAGPTDALEEQV